VMILAMKKMSWLATFLSGAVFAAGINL
jgi:hypothetical protein